MALSDRRGVAEDGAGVHPDAERLAQYADGVLRGSARRDIERHLVGCAQCREALVDTLAFLAADSPQSATGTRPEPVVVFPNRRRWILVGGGLAAAAALLVTLTVQPEWVRRIVGRDNRPELEQLVAALAQEPTRPVEGRLTGGFPYSPPPTLRGGTGRQPSPEVSIAAATLQQRARAQPTPANEAAAGVAYLVLGEADRAVAALETAARTSPRPSTLSDLAAAYLARGGTGRDDLLKARDAANRAIAAGEAPVEAWFNRALAIQRLGATEDAVRAWQEYLQRESSSQWAAEARQYVEAAGRLQ